MRRGTGGALASRLSLRESNGERRTAASGLRRPKALTTSRRRVRARGRIQTDSRGDAGPCGRRSERRSRAVVVHVPSEAWRMQRAPPFDDREAASKATRRRRVLEGGGEAGSAHSSVRPRLARCRRRRRRAYRRVFTARLLHANRRMQASGGLQSEDSRPDSVPAKERSRCSMDETGAPTCRSGRRARKRAPERTIASPRCSIGESTRLEASNWRMESEQPEANAARIREGGTGRRGLGLELRAQQRTLWGAGCGQEGDRGTLQRAAAAGQRRQPVSRSARSRSTRNPQPATRSPQPAGPARGLRRDSSWRASRAGTGSLGCTQGR